MAAALIALTMSAYVQVSSQGQAEVSMSTDSTWSGNSDLLDNGNLVYALQGISVLLNETSNASGFVEKSVNAFDSDGDLLPKIILGSPDIVPGKQYLIRLRYTFVNGTDGSIKYGESSTQSLYVKSVPVTPSGISNTVRPDDAGLSVNISSLYTRLSNSDGYDQIQKIRYYLSKVGGNATGDLIQADIDLDQVNGVRVYNKWYSIGNLTNGQKYEIAYRVVNSMGESGLSETYTVTPSDLPAQITGLKAVNDFSDLVNSVNSSQSSTLKLYWSKPIDYDTLNSGDSPVPVTSYTLRKQEMAWSTENNRYEPVGSAVENVLPHDANSVARPSYELQSAVTDSGIEYHYVYSYPMSASDYGKVFQFTVFATNANGSGPESISSNRIASFINPSPQDFSLEHQTEQVTTTGVPVTRYNGKLDLVISVLSALNGLEDTPEVPVSNVYEADGVTVFNKRDVEMELTVESDEQIPSLIFSDKVTFLEKYVTESRPFTTGGTTTSRTVGIRSNEWRIDDIGTNIANFGTLSNGTKYRYSLKRLGTDPLDSDNEYKSVAQLLLRTQFESPSPVSKIQAYSINDDFTPVTVEGAPGVRVLFEQISVADMNGTNAFMDGENNVEYELRSNSQSIAGLSRIQHDSNDHDAIREFVIPSTIGTVNNLYIRVYIYNPELDQEIEGDESSPAVSEKAITYPIAVSSLQSVVSSDGETVTVSWTKQSVSGLSGFLSANVYNKVYLYNDTTNSQIASHEVSYSATQSHTFTNLTLGNIYKIYVVSYGKYSKTDLDGTTNKYTDAIVRKNFVAAAITAVGNPGVPTNIEAYPSADKVIFNYDAVADANLKGNDVNNLVYHFILNSDDAHFPYQSSAQDAPLQASVANVSGTDEAVITKGYTSVSQSSARANAVNLVTETLYNYAMYVVSSVGDEAIQHTEDLLNEAGATELTLVSVPTTPLKDIMGEVDIGHEKLYINNNVPTPEVEATAGEGSITLSIKKPANVPNEMVIVLDNNDALDANDESVPIFSTINVRTALTATSGLFALENADKSSPIGGINYGASGYNFGVTTSAGVQYYNVTIRNLVNGILNNVQVRFANTVNGYDFFGETTSVQIAAEAPPTAPQNPSFTVDNKVINLSWNSPSNTGGAGLAGNGPLLYRVVVKTGVTQVSQHSAISDTFFQLNTSNFAAIANGTDYSVDIIAYYVKSGNNVESQSASIAQIRPNVAPLSPSVTVTRGDNKLIVAIITVSAAQSSLYPLSSIQLVYKKSNETAYTSETTFSDNINNGSQPLSYEITGLLNGQSYDVKVVCVRNYTYAQAPSDVLILSQIPFGVPTVNASTATRPVGNIKALDLTVSLNGSGSITRIVALGKSLNSSAIGILNLSGVSLPTVTTGGAASSTVAANQTASFRLDFGATIPEGLNDAIIVVNTTNGTDAGAYSLSSSGSQYFVDNL